MASTLRLSVERGERYVRLNFLFRLLFGIYFILYIGHLALWGGYQAAALLVAGVNWILALITGHNQRTLTDYLRKFMRFDLRMKTSLLGMVEPIPHIDVNRDNPEFPARLSVEAVDRTTVVFCFLRLSFLIHVLLLPHWICIAFLRLAVGIAYIIAFFAVLFTGRWPEGIFNFLLGYYRWYYRVVEYWYGLTDTYPPFSMS